MFDIGDKVRTILGDEGIVVNITWPDDNQETYTVHFPNLGEPGEEAEEGQFMRNQLAISFEKKAKKKASRKVKNEVFAIPASEEMVKKFSIKGCSLPEATRPYRRIVDSPYNRNLAESKITGTKWWT